MRINGDYRRNGYAHIERLTPPEVTKAVLRQVKADLPDMTRRFLSHAPIIRKTSIDIYERDYPPMLQLLWGLTGAMEDLTGRPLLPTYNYFRLYRRDDICRIHSDRPACEHSVSLTLGYSDGQVWPFEVGTEPIEAPEDIESNFRGAPSVAIAMQPGDAIIYRGVEHRHGRSTPNPNRWSAHMFLHWVDRDGPYAGEAFDLRHAKLDPASEADFDL